MPRLVPRPIPGLPAGPRPAPPVVRAGPAMVPVVPPAAEQARILFIHRHDRLPEALRQRVSQVPAGPAAEPASTGTVILQERPAQLRIIPRSEVPQLKTPPPPTQP